METKAVLGAVENGNAVVLVTVAAGKVLDRRTVELTEGLPTHPHHHEGSWAVGRYLDSPWARPMALADAIALVAKVREASEGGARAALAAVAAAVAQPIEAIALRQCPELPPTVEARIRDNRAQTMADTVMYREVLAAAAVERGWHVHWYDRDAVLGKAGLEDELRAMGKTVGPPWQAAHKLAAAAAMGAVSREKKGGRKGR